MARLICGITDLSTVNPNLEKEWNYKKNGMLLPDQIGANSHKKVWWKCEKGHQWESKIHNRNLGKRCPYCAGHIPIQGETDLATVNPKLKKEWNYEQNGKLKPEHVMPNSNKKVWWNCEKGHQWESKIYSRNQGNGCPYCAGRIPIQGETDLATVNPKLTKEWNYERNGKLKPEHVMPNSKKKVWWKCDKGHEWVSIIQNRNIGNSCPYCAGYIPIQGETDLATVNPKLKKEWNYEQNGKLKPEHVMPNSNKKVWWKCDKGHEWVASVAKRHGEQKCPYCVGKIVIKGKTDFATVNPKLAKEWNYERNKKLLPEDILPNSNKIVWWNCKKGHEWKASVANRQKGNGCSYCSGHYAISGKTDLVSVNPELAKEWNYERNKKLLPEDVLPNSNKKIWWNCERGHEWKAAIFSRNRGSGCSKCNKMDNIEKVKP